jgi:CSLREA domain-containing protein
MKRHAITYVCRPALIVVALLFVTSVSSRATKDHTIQPQRGDDPVAVQAAERGQPWMNLLDGRELLTSYTSADGWTQLMAHRLAQPTALASADVDEDGMPDLLSGYAGPGGGLLTVHRGNEDFLFPNSAAARQRQAAGRYVDAPFLPEARVVELPVAPEFLGAGDFDADGHWDIVAAARAGEALHWLPGDGRGGFGAAKQIPLPGGVTALVAGEINRRDGLTDVIVAVNGSDGPQVWVFESPAGAIEGQPEILALPAEATALALGQLDESPEMDLVVAAANEVLIVHGRDRRLSFEASRQAEVPAPTINARGFDFTITALAIGDFVWDETHQTDIALLAEDGAIRILANPHRAAINAGAHGEAPVQESSTDALTVPAAVPGRPLMLAEWPSQWLTTNLWPQASGLVRVKISSLPSDDLMVLDHAHHQVHVLTTDSGPRISDKAPRHTVALDVIGQPVAVLPMRLNVDALSDLVILCEGSSAPAVTLTAPLATFTVNSTADTDDGTCDSATPGGCTLREAINAANATMAADMIDFDLGAGTPSITITSDLPTIDEPVTIDGSAGPGMATRVELNGNNRLIDGLVINAGSSTVRSLVINRFGDDGIVLENNGGNIIENNFIGTNAAGTADLGNSFDGVFIGVSNNTVGGMSAMARNVISGNIDSGVEISGPGAMGNLVQGNYIGTDVNGTNALENDGAGVRIDGAPSNTVGGTSAGARNIISGNVGSDGVFIFNASAMGNLVQGNYIGTDVTGTLGLGNGAAGVQITSASMNTVGGTSAGARNVISSNAIGVRITVAPGNQVQGNYIGTDVNGTADLGNFNSGVIIESASGNTIGGTAAGAGNTIAFNGFTFPFIGVNGDGVTVLGGTGNRIDPNSIFSNVNLGIDLNDNGVTPNDTGDGDGGANNLQNFPTLTTVQIDGAGDLVIQYMVDSTTANSAYPLSIEFFEADSAASGQGKSFLGSDTFTAADFMAGSAMVNLGDAAALGVTAGDPIVATATDDNGNTSEFTSPAALVEAMPCSITCPNDVLQSNDPGQCGANVTYLAPMTTGDCGTVVCTPPSGSFFPVGTTTVTCKSNNGAGPEMCTFNVTVTDDQSPTITCPANQTVQAGANCQATVNPGSATATDNCPASPTVMGTRSDGMALNSPYPLGVTTITWTATDAAGNMSTCTQTITVTNAAPTANAGSDQAVDEGTLVTLSGSASDPNPGQTLSYQWVQLSGPPVTLTNATLPVATFDAPEVPDLECATLVFQFRATDNCAATDGDTVVIVVRDTLMLAGNGHCVIIRPNCNLSGGTYCWVSGTDGRVFRGPVRITVQSNGMVNLMSGSADPNLFQAMVNLTTRTGRAQFQSPRTNPTRTETINPTNIDVSRCNCS